MGRKRDEANSKLGDYVQRRTGGGLELRFPIPHDVRPAFLDANGRPRFQIIRSLGTKDIRLANAKADALRASIRADIMKVRQAQSSGNLDGFLRDLFDEELASFQRQTAFDAKTVLIRPGSSLLEERQGSRSINTRALLSADPKERLATAGWAAELYLRLQGRDPDGSPEFQEIVDRCANVLADALIAQNELAAGRAIPVRTSSLPEKASAQSDLSNSASPRGAYKISEYFKQIYLPAVKTAANIRGPNTISGKAQALKLFVDLVGDFSIGSIKKGELWSFHDDLLVLPNSRELQEPHRSLTPREQIDGLKSGSSLPRRSTPRQSIVTFQA